MFQPEAWPTRLSNAFKALIRRQILADVKGRPATMTPGGPFVEPPGPARLSMGRTVGHGKRQAFLSPAEQVTLFGFYSSGAGTVQDSLVAQQIARHGAYILLDVTLDGDRKDMLAYLHRRAETEASFRVLNVDSWGTSHTYNPLVRGTTQEVAERVVTAMMGPTYLSSRMTEAEHLGAVSLLRVLLQALRDRDNVAQFDRLNQALESDAGFRELIASPQLHAATKDELRVRLADYRTSPEGSYDLNLVRAPLARMLRVLPHFARGTLGEVVNVEKPEIDLLDVLNTSKGLFVMLPTMGKDIVAITLGRLITADMTDSLAALSVAPRDPEQPSALVVTVDAPYLASGQLANTFSAARAAGAGLVAGVASPADLESLSEADRAALMGNTKTKVFFQLNSRATPADLRRVGELLVSEGASVELPNVMARLVDTPPGKGFVAERSRS